MTDSGAPSGVPAPLRRVELFGLPFVDAASEADVATALLDGWAFTTRDGERTGPDRVVVTPNVDQMVARDRALDRVTDELFASAGLVLPDGQPVVWASRWLGRPLQARLAGSTLVEQLWPRIVAEGRRILVVASSAEVRDRLQDAGQGVILAPMLAAGDDAGLAALVEQCADELVAHPAEMVFVTLGFPKQYRIIDGLLQACRARGIQPPVLLAVGASFDMLFGIKRRAPRWVQRWGLEWFFRFAQEPRRLFRRYFVDDVAFLGVVRRERARLRRGGDRPADAPA